MEIISQSANDQEEKNLSTLTETVRKTLTETYKVNIPTECTGFIVRCLRIKDYDTEKAAKLVKNFAKSITDLDDIIDKFQPRFYKEMFYNGTFSILNSRDSLGRQVIVSRIAKWDPKAFDFDGTACAAMLLFSFVVGQSAETQRKGIVFVHDLSDFGMHHIKALKAGRLTQLVSLMQDGSPGRIKGIHMIFHPKIFGMIYQLVKPFLKEKLSKRVHFHGDNLSSLHKHLSVEILPKSLGGLREDSECLDTALIEKLIDTNTIHKELKAYKVPSV